MMATSANSASNSLAGRSERLSLASLVAFLTVGLSDNQLVAPILPVIAEGLGTGITQIGISVSAYALSAAAAALCIGPSSDRLGRKPFLIGAGVAFAIASALAASVAQLSGFIVARCLAGAAAGVISALVVAAVADLIPYDRRGKAMSWVAVAYFAAPILVIPLAAVMTERFGWRPNYWAFCLVATLATIFLSVGYRELAGESSDDPEVVARSTSVVAQYSKFAESQSLVAGAASAFFVSGGFSGFLLYLGAHLSSRFSLSPSDVGLVFLLCGGFGVLGAVGAGRLADRIGKKVVAIVASLVLAATLFIMPHTVGWVLYAVLALAGFSALSRVAPLQSLVTELVASEQRASYVALRNTLSQLGIGAAALVGARLYPLGFDRICWMTGGMSLVAVGLLWLIDEPVTGAHAS